MSDADEAAADRRQLEDELQPLRGDRAGAEAGVHPDGEGLPALEVVVLPPFTDLRTVQTLVDGDKLKIGYGAQDLSPFAKGAYTGDISGPMLAKLGCSYVLCGHSERRQYHHEDDALVNAKVKAALAVSITPILCVGESLETRRAGEHVAHCMASAGAVAGQGAGRGGGLHGDRLRAGLGDRHRRGRQPRRRAGDVPPRSGNIFRPRMAPKPARVCVSCMAGPSRATTSRLSWRSRTWTAPSSAAPVWTPVSSRRSAGIVRWRRTAETVIKVKGREDSRWRSRSRSS